MMKINLNTTSFLVIILAAIFASACGAKLNAGVEPVNKTAEGLAIKGFDSVAYFAAQSAVQGKPEYEFAWKGAKWLFSSAENLEKFRQNPEAYAPQYGGYCSYAVSHGYTANGDPEAWNVVDGKLYLNFNKQVREMWEKEQAEFIQKGNQNWQEFQAKKPEHKGN